LKSVIANEYTDVGFSQKFPMPTAKIKPKVTQQEKK
jgi:hypothetical protein